MLKPKLYINTTPPPKSVEEAQAFIGFVGFYRNFIPCFSFHGLTPTTSIRHINPTLSAILQYPNDTKLFIVATDASSCGIEAVVLQMNDSKEMPVDYANKFLIKGQKITVPPNAKPQL